MNGNSNSNNKAGRIFLGRDEKTYGKEGIGWVPYDPDFECGGPPGTPDRRCPFPPVSYGRDTYLLPAAGSPNGDHQQPNRSAAAAAASSGRLLHVGIASYRDPLCPVTLYNAFTKARYPDRLRVRVIQQNDPTVDTDCLVGYCHLMERDYNSNNKGGGGEFRCPHEDQVFVHQVHAKEAKGPTFARALLSEDVNLAWRKGDVDVQDFCMSLDSHMDFEPEWDEGVVNMWDLAENEYAFLSTYVAGNEQLGMNLNGVHEVPHLCMVTFTSSVRTHATKCMNNMPKPKLTNAIYGAGLAFSKCHAELKVPVDPHTPYVFDGEEFNRAARLWTHGYDIYSPHRVYVLHNYHDSQSNPTTTTWHRNTDREASQAAVRRLNNLIDVPLQDAHAPHMSDDEKLLLRQSKYGLGDRRTLDQLIQFSGIDLRHRRPSIDGKNRCGNIQWVPFVESTRGVNVIPRFDEMENPLDEYDSGSVWSNPSAALAAGLVESNDVGRNVNAGGSGGRVAKTGNGGEGSKGGVVTTSAEKAGREAGEIELADGFKTGLRAGGAAASAAARRMFKSPTGAQEVQMRDHGIQHLPLPVKLGLCFVGLGLVLAVMVAKMTARKGRGTRKHHGRKKRSA